MTRGFAILFVLLCSVTGFAASIIDVMPANPLVMQSHLVLNPGAVKIDPPWFRTEYVITNSVGQDITIVGLEIDVTSIEGITTTYTIELPMAMEVPMFMSRIIPNIYIGSLPASASTVYSVTVNMQGWVGPMNAPQFRLANTIKFETQ